MASPDEPRNASLLRRSCSFVVLVVLYLLPAFFLVWLVAAASWREGGANAFRYVGF